MACTYTFYVDDITNELTTNRLPNQQTDFNKVEHYFNINFVCGITTILCLADQDSDVCIKSQIKATTKKSLTKIYTNIINQAKKTTFLALA